MLTAEVKINGERVGFIQAKNVKTLSDAPGDFIGERKQVCEYDCRVEQNPLNPLSDPYRGWRFAITHDRRFGWQGLLHKITGEIMPQIVETISAKEE